jgi:histidinol-phosphate aminotransferase
MSNPNFLAGTRVRLYESEISVPIVAARFGLHPATIVDFSLNINPFGPPPAAVAAARRALDRCNEYPDTRLGRLRDALARHHSVDPDQVLFGAGLDDVIKLLLQAWSAEGDHVLVHLPTFPRYELEARLHGCHVVAVESTPPWAIDIGRLRTALANHRIALAFLCTPNNPTGAIIAPDQVRELARAFPETLFIVDEALCNPLDSAAVPLVQTEPNVVVLRTFSKSFGLAGLRIGYALGPARLLQIAELGRPPFNVGTAGEAAAVAALDDHGFLESCYATFHVEAAAFIEALEKQPGYRLRGRYANMLLIELTRRSATDCIDALAAKGVLVADAACFGGLDGHATIRVSLRDRAANAQLLAALELVQ